MCNVKRLPFLTRRSAREQFSRCFGLVLIVVAALVLPGCVSLETMAPPVEGTVIQQASIHGTDVQSLRRGRAIYLNQCVRCHTVMAVNDYDVAEWRALMPEMGKEAKLTGEQEQDVLDYVLAAHAAIQIDAAAGNKQR